MSVLAQAALQRGDGERCVALLAATETLLAQAGIEVDSDERRRRGENLTQARALLAAPAFDAAWNAGSALSLQEAILVGQSVATALPEGVRTTSPAG